MIYLTFDFFLRVRSRTLCAQWTCHVLWTRLSLPPCPYHVPPACVLVRFPFCFTCSLTCMNMDCQLVSGYLSVSRFPFSSRQLVYLRFSLMSISFCLNDSSLYLPLPLTLTCYGLSTRPLTCLLTHLPFTNICNCTQ